jgi:hypothetical protein
VGRGQPGHVLRDEERHGAARVWLRISQASLDLKDKYGVSPNANGLERFIPATRRQNFLIPPRRHRSFPLLELT